MSDLKGAVIGCGPRARYHVQGMMDAAGMTCACAADLDHERADSFAREFGIKAYYDPAEMIEAEAPDIVGIVTKEGPRAQLTAMCAQRRVPAICAEKPMARTLDQAREMVRVCEEHGTILTVSQQMTFCREFEMLKECIASGEVGELRLMRNISYGQLMEQGTHGVDMLLWLREGHEVVRVMGQAEDTADANKTAHPAPVFSLGYLVFDDDVRAVVEAGRSFPADPAVEGTWLQKRVTVLGTEGVAEAVVGNFFRKMTPEGLGWQYVATGRESWDNATPRFYEELARVVREGGTHRNNAKRSLAGFECLQAIFKSCMDRDSVTLPLPDGVTPLEDLLAAFGVEPQVQ